MNPTVAMQVIAGGGWCEHERVDFRVEGTREATVLAKTPPP